MSPLHTAPSVLIRAARGSDGRALEALAELDSSIVPAGQLLVAEADGEMVAALGAGVRRAHRQPVPPDRRRGRAARAPRRPPPRAAQPPLLHGPAGPARGARPHRVTLSTTSPPLGSPAGADPDAPAGAPPWQIWTCLWIVYIVWGSTYLAIRIMVETVPPLLGASARFFVAGAVMLAVLAARRGIAVLRPDARPAAERRTRRAAPPGRQRRRQRRRAGGALEHRRAADRLRAPVGDPHASRRPRRRVEAGRRGHPRRVRRRRAARAPG